MTGMRLKTRVCSKTISTDGDGIDNDCDGSIDEELCNGIDDDADGEVDEDCGSKSLCSTSHSARAFGPLPQWDSSCEI